MITTEGPFKPRSGLGDDIITLGNNGKIKKTGQPSNWVNADDAADKQSKLVAHPAYNVGFGSTLPTASWVGWTAAQCDIAGISTAGMDPNKPSERKKVQINVPRSNIATVRLYGGAKGGQLNFFELYEKADDRKARHAALRAAGYQPPFPRADQFYKNKHQSHVQVGLSTSPHNIDKTE
jgi:hypothetical protein